MPRGPFRLIILDNITNQSAGDCPEFPDEWEGRSGTSNPGIFTSAEDFCLNPKPLRSCGDLTVHEVTHGLDMVIRQQLDPYFFQQADDCWRDAIRRKVYQKAYAAADRHEKKKHLRKNDPGGYELLKSFLIEIKHPEDDSFWWEDDEY
eukprot:scaffold18944_cov54-Attheya_sp.AAC.2